MLQMMFACSSILTSRKRMPKHPQKLITIRGGKWGRGGQQWQRGEQYFKGNCLVIRLWHSFREELLLIEFPVKLRKLWTPEISQEVLLCSDPLQQRSGHASKPQNHKLIDDIRIPRRSWDERLHSMITRLKPGTFWQTHKQTLASRGWIAAKR